MSVELQIVLFFVCFAGSAFFSGTETGVLSVNHARLVHLVRSGSKTARVLHRYVSDMQQFLAMTLVGNNLMNVMVSTFSASLAQSCFPDHRAAQTAWAVAMAFAVLFFCEYLPKLFFTSRPLRRTLMAVRGFRWAEGVLSPLATLVLFVTRWLVPRNRNASNQRFLMTREYIQNVVSDPREGARITAVERLMINRVLALQSLTAEQVMTPLARVSRTTEDASLGECYRLVRDSGHARLPVFSADGARCVGVLNALDVLTSGPVSETTRISNLMRDPFFVRADVRADDVLPLMRKNRQPLAMVRGGAEETVLGIITTENIMDALIGSLQTPPRGAVV